MSLKNENIISNNIWNQNKLRHGAIRTCDMTRHLRMAGAIFSRANYYLQFAICIATVIICRSIDNLNILSVLQQHLRVDPQLFH